MQEHCQKNVSQEWIWVLSWDFQNILEEEDQMTKRQYVHASANATTAATFTTTTAVTTLITTSIATTCKAKSIKMKITKVLW